MENWGCVFYHFTSLLEGNDDADWNRCFTELVVHELAHFYFGNLVAMPFHIKEGLAQYLGIHIADIILEETTNMNELISQGSEHTLEVAKNSYGMGAKFEAKKKFR
jgi:aminopeptidase N